MSLTHEETERDETASLIGSDKVEGTAVYGPDEEKIGRVERVMIGKRDGRVAYAVLSFGGFLGIGDRHVALPWDQLTYDEELGGYLVNVSRDRLEGAPSYEPDRGWDADYGREARGYWGPAGPGGMPVL